MYIYTNTLHTEHGRRTCQKHAIPAGRDVRRVARNVLVTGRQESRPVPIMGSRFFFTLQAWSAGQASRFLGVEHTTRRCSTEIPIRMMDRA